MTSYKMTFFPIKAIAEGIRLLLAYGGDKLENIFITEEEWAVIKPTTQFGLMPIFEFDGKSYSQSVAICRYLGRNYGLVGDNPLEDLEIDVIIDAISDFRTKCADAHYEVDKELKEKKYVDIVETVVPFFLKKFDAIAAANNGHLALGKLTWADFYFTGIYDYFTWMSRTNIDEKAPNLRKVVDNVLALPVIVSYYETAPKLTS